MKYKHLAMIMGVMITATSVGYGNSICRREQDRKYSGCR